MLSCQRDNRHDESAHPRQRHPRADGERTRGAILRTAASLATVDGLEGLSIGNLTPRPASARAACTRTSAPSRNSSWPPWTRPADPRRRSHTARARGPPWPGRADSGVRGVFQLPAAPRLPRRLLLRYTGAGDGHPPRASQERVAAIQSGFTALLRAFAATALEQHELPPTRTPTGSPSSCMRCSWPPTPNSSCTTTQQSWTWHARSSASG